MDESQMAAPAGSAPHRVSVTDRVTRIKMLGSYLDDIKLEEERTDRWHSRGSGRTWQTKMT